MNIVILSGSPHKQGVTARLADRFQAGAEAAGHQVSRFDVAFMDVHPCQGCYYCEAHEGRCHWEDDMTNIIGPALLQAEAVVFVSPLYYYGFTAQLKQVLDRFFSINGQLLHSGKKALLISAGGDKDDYMMDGVKAHLACVLNYLDWQDGGALLARGLYSPEDLEGTDYEQQAFELGRSLK